MATCQYCGRFYTPNYDPESDALDMCSYCQAASNGGSYVNSKEWDCEHVIEDHQYYYEQKS